MLNTIQDKPNSYLTVEEMEQLLAFLEELDLLPDIASREAFVKTIHNDFSISPALKYNLAIENRTLEASQVWVCANWYDGKEITQFLLLSKFTLNMVKAGLGNPYLNDPEIVDGFVRRCFSIYNKTEAFDKRQPADYFLANLPTRALTEQAIGWMLKRAGDAFHHTSLVDLICGYARQQYELDEAIPNNWVIKMYAADSVPFGVKGY